MHIPFVSMKSIRTDFDAAMRRQGYVRAKVMYEKWGITASQFQKYQKKGFTCDSFIVNGVRYISVDAKGPDLMCCERCLSGCYEVPEPDILEAVEPEED